MNKKLTTKLYFYDDEGIKQKGANPYLFGDCTGLFGDCTGLFGNCSNLFGNCTDLYGNCTEIKGDCSNLSGNCSDLCGDCSGLKGDCSGIVGDCSGMNIDFNLYRIATRDRQNGIDIKVFNMLKRKKTETNLEKIMDEILQEYLKASKKFKPMASPHEGYAVIKEELDELWDEIKINSNPLNNMRNEAIQVAAMGMRFVIDCCSKENKTSLTNLKKGQIVYLGGSYGMKKAKIEEVFPNYLTKIYLGYWVDVKLENNKIIAVPSYIIEKA